MINLRKTLGSLLAQTETARARSAPSEFVIGSRAQMSLSFLSHNLSQPAEPTLLGVMPGEAPQAAGVFLYDKKTVDLKQFLQDKIQRRHLWPTKGEDGDPIDVLVLHDAATSPGLVMKCKTIGVLEVVQKEGGKKKIRNDRLITVPRDSHREQSEDYARDLSKQIPGGNRKFFVPTDELEDKKLEFLGWKGPKTGKKFIDGASNRYNRLARNPR